VWVLAIPAVEVGGCSAVVRIQILTRERGDVDRARSSSICPRGLVGVYVTDD
jgi:hypothetical protein